MSTIQLSAELREGKGKGASRRLRHANRLPAILYGVGKDAVSLSLLQKDVQYVMQDETFYSQVLSLTVDGKAEDVLVKDIQHHPYKTIVMHVDFQRVDANKVVHVHVPLHFTGEDIAPGVKTEGGAISHVMMEVEVACLPNLIPAYIEVDLSEMHLGDILHLTDLKLPEGVQVLALTHGDEHEHDTAVANIHMRKTIAEPEDEEATAEVEPAADEGDKSDKDDKSE